MILDWLSQLLGARVERRASIQPLWGGHGELFRVAIDGTPAVVKYARLPVDHNAGTLRKRRSFDTELAFYRDVASPCRVPRLLAGDRRDDEWILVLEDLEAAGFTEQYDEPRGPALDAILCWLAAFHAHFLDDVPAEPGTYWHIDTRRDELVAIEDYALRAAAPAIAEQLASARFQTRVHGDPKEQNFLFTRAYDVAAVDFQYTGRACPMTDLAYLLYGRSDNPHVHVDTYFRYLDADVAIEAEWRALFPVAQLDFCRFLAGWRPELWRADVRGQAFVRQMLEA